MKRLAPSILSGMVVVGLLILWALAAASPAQGDVLRIPVPEVSRGEPGTQKQVAGLLVPTDLQGQTCDVSLVGVNNGSVHPGNDLLVRNGPTGQITFADVESVPNETVSRTEPDVVLGDRVSVWVRFGSDGVTSTGFELTFDCQPPATTTTTTIVTTTTQPPVVTTIPTSVPPPAKPEPPTVTTPRYTG